MSSSTEQIKERLPIVEVLSSYIKLERSGSNYKARCPFHNEKTPSFMVSPSRNTYHCFGCNRGGDIFSFVEEIEGIDFKRALEILAERAGVQIERIDPKLKSDESRNYQILEDSTKHFETNLLLNEEAKNYLKNRGLTEESVRTWRIGYAKNEWRELSIYLKGKKWSEQEMEKVGLLIKGDKGYYDRFRGRITFPIANTQGKIVGFSARHFVSEDNKETDTAKYINTPETPLYNKSKILFGFDKAKQSIMQKDFAVLVEGQMDLVMSHQAGITNTVASSGTALTEEHLKMIKRFTDKLVMALDNDSAGFSASDRGVMMALELGMDVKIAKLPEGMDPADLVIKDKNAFVESIEKAKHIIDFILESLIEKETDSRKLRTEIWRLVLPCIAVIRNRIEQAHFVGRVAGALGIAEEPVWEEVKKSSVKLYESKNEPSKKDEDSRESKIRDKIAGIIFWQEGDEEDKRIIDVEASKKRYKEIGEEEKMSKEKRENLALQAEVYYKGSTRLKESLEELFLTLERELLERELKGVMEMLRVAESAGNEEMVKNMFEKFHDISKKINEIKQKFK